METLIKEIEVRIASLEKDNLMDSEKKIILIKENNRILCRCQQLWLDALPASKSIEKVINQDWL